MSGPDVVNDFEAWARVSAELADRGEDERPQFLHALGLSAVWRNANAAWGRAIASDIVEMRMDRAQRYAEICAEVQAVGRGDLIGDDDVLSLSQSEDDELDLQVTHRMRAVSAPVEVTSAPPTRQVRSRLRRQAKTVNLHESLATERGSLDDTGETSIYEGTLPSPQEGWPLEHYARFMAERQAKGKQATSVDSQYGLSPEESGHVIRVWDARLARDASLRERYEALVESHRAALNRRDG